MRILTSLIRLVGAAFLPIRKNGCFFLFMLVLGWICIKYEVPGVKNYKPYEFSVQELFFDLYLLCLLLALIPKAVRRWVRFLAAAALYIMAVIDIFCFVKFDSTFNPSMLMLVSETTKSETKEFFSTYLTPDVIFSPLGAVVLLMIAHIIWGCILRWAERKRKNRRRNLTVSVLSDNLNRWGDVIQPAAGLACIVIFVIAAANVWENKRLMTKLMTRDSIGQVEHTLTEKDKAQLYIPVYRFIFSMYSNQLASTQVDDLKEAVKEVAVDSCSFRSRNIILIIGESYNKYHSQLYGYEKPTTPRQLWLQKEGYLVPFTDVVSPWNLTSYVFKNVFSMHTVGEEGQWSDAPLFPEIFRKAGYHVTFLTNQFLPKAKSAVYDFSGGFFLNDQELSRAQFDTRNSRLHTYDEGLLDDYDSLKVHNTDAQLTIFHLMGQHVDYRLRYPKDRKKFVSDEYKVRPKLLTQHRVRIAQYDNATLYNDSVVAAIVNRFYNDDAIIIYMPDHSEEIYNNDSGIFGRRHSMKVDYRLAREEFEIPFWIWCSKKYAESHPDIFRAIWLNRQKPLMTDALAHTLLSIAGIHCKDYKAEYDILSPEYDTQRPRILKGEADYNILKQQAQQKE